MVHQTMHAAGPAGAGRSRSPTYPELYPALQPHLSAPQRRTDGSQAATTGGTHHTGHRASASSWLTPASASSNICRAEMTGINCLQDQCTVWASLGGQVTCQVCPSPARPAEGVPRVPGPCPRHA